MLKPVVLPKNAFKLFFQSLKGLGTVYAPVKVSEKSYSFKEVHSPEEIAFEALRTILPPKKFFYPQEETLIRYKNGDFEEVQPEKKFQVIFGVHPCDLASLGILDTIFSSEPADSHYLKRREQSLLVGLSCMPDKHCFCNAMNADTAGSAYDLFLTDTGEEYFIEIRSAKGVELIKSLAEKVSDANPENHEAYKEFWKKREAAFSHGLETENLRSLLDLEWENQIWDEMGKRCLSCGNCTPVCPTCYCFDLVDIAGLNAKEGERVRQWDSCQFVGFAQVNGDFNFRATPADRLKFWYRHKLHGFDDAYGFKTCVGCGRCTESCPAGIDDIVQVVKILQGKKENKHYEP
ncbi:MAG: 4Fe-4S dicluster domain-containing protein [Candidatus Obscuribacterales bacterium]|nr:4Fe-4S dicluster domain-containing protein [Candidatus Obscuribacterales bacterium]